MSDWSTIVVDVLVVLGTAAMTLSIVGLVRLPQSYVKIHSAGKAVVLGVLAVLAASLLTGTDVLFRALAVGGFLLLTAPVGSHALARLARHVPESDRASSGPSTGDDR